MHILYQSTQVFPTQEEVAEGRELSISEVISQRVSAVRQLESNPNSYDAKLNLHRAQRKVRTQNQCACLNYDILTLFLLLLFKDLNSSEFSSLNIIKKWTHAHS